MGRIPRTRREGAIPRKQALDLGAYGVVWPHISSVEEAYSAVAACAIHASRTSRSTSRRHPRRRPTQAVRYWGLAQDYYDRATSALTPRARFRDPDDGGHPRIDSSTASSRGAGHRAILIAKATSRRSLASAPVQHPEVLKWMARVVDTCKRTTCRSATRMSTAQCRAHSRRGLRFLMAAPVRSYAALDKGMKLAGRREVVSSE